ncbi:MAG TPA: lysylphosphatidylglycerol synthase transmembrane domain-containing protein [bacterium]|nr:lysylphosphatidylglycerol synthase transmembrane domain-containing protein [bacterium]
MKRLLHVVLAAAITALTLLYALWGVNFEKLGHLLAGADYRLVAPFLGFLFLFFLFTGLNWNLILRSQGRYRLRQTAPAMMIGFAGNNVLPAHLGELVRSVVFGRQQGLSASAVFMTLVVERLLDVFAILVYYFVAVLLIHPFPESIRVGAGATAAVIAVACVGIAVFLRFPRVFERLWERYSRPLPAALRTRGSHLLHNAVLGLSALKSPALLAAMVLHALAKWASCGGMVWLALLAFGTHVPWAVCMIVVAVFAVAVTLPTAPGFVGTAQAVFVFALGPFGVPQETALAASVLYLVAQWIPVTLVGAFCFATTGLHLREVRSEAEHLQT